MLSSELPFDEASGMELQVKNILIPSPCAVVNARLWIPEVIPAVHP